MKQRIATCATRASLYQNLEKHYLEEAEKTTDPAKKKGWLDRAAEAAQKVTSPNPNP
jgi:hypothetical protein